jgi:tyrosine-specific transport protein
MNSKLFGGILLIIGTTVGAGMLALPVATAQLGFWNSLVLLIGCWATMTICAFIFLEVNLWLPPKSNLISMTEKTLGKHAKVAVWIVYLVLQYSILCAYIAGGGDVCHYVLLSSGIKISLSTALVLFTFIFGFVVYCGIRYVDYLNRWLMSVKLGALIILIILMLPFVSPSYLANSEIYKVNFPANLSVVTIAFATMMVIPSLRTYFDDDIRSLRKAIFIGTLIPLVLYVAWDMVILGVVPLDGNTSMRQILNSSSPNSVLIAAISAILQNDIVTLLTKLFTSICMITSFLSISLCLSDFWADGMGITKQGKNNIVIFSATYLPPIIIVLFYSDVFIRSLRYAGLCCFILMIFLPPLMAWQGRYYRFIAHGYQIPGGKFLLAILIIFGIAMVSFGFESINLVD